MKPRVVFDTNTLISATFWRGAPFRCVEAARNGLVEGITCREIIAEFTEKIATKFQQPPDEVIFILADVLTFLRIVPIAGTLRVIRADPDDDKIIECGVVAQATHIVSGDRRHVLPLKEYQGIMILDATTFLAAVEQQAEE